MNTYFKIMAQDTMGVYNYLDYKSKTSANEPYWSTSGGKDFHSEKRVLAELELIENDFVNGVGNFFNDEIKPDTIEIIEVSYTTFKKLDIQKRTEEIRFEKIKKSMSEEDFDFLLTRINKNV